MDNPFEEMGGEDFGNHPHTHGEPTQSSRDIAQRAAAEAIGGDEVLASEETQYIDFTETETEQEYVEPEYVDESVEVTAEGEGPVPGSVLTEADIATLTEMGLDIPSLPADATLEMQDMYNSLVQNVIDTQYTTQRHVLDAQEAILQMQDLKNMLSTEDGQQKMLLSMAMSNPELFGRASEIVERMSSDSDYAESVKRQMEADMRMQALERKEQAFAQTQIERRAKQVENHVVRQARRYGIDESMAKELVVSRIFRNESERGQRDITFEEIDQIVGGIAKRYGSRPVKRPMQQTKEAQAPQRPAGPTNRNRQPGPEESSAPMRTGSDVMDNLRNAVRESGRRMKNQGL